MKKRIWKATVCAVCVVLAVIFSISIYSDGKEKEKSRMFVCAESVGESGRFDGIDIPSDIKLFSSFEKAEKAEKEETDADEVLTPLDETEEEIKKLELPSAEGASQIMYSTYKSREYIRVGKISSAESLKLSFDLSGYDVLPDGRVMGIGIFAQGSDNSETEYSKTLIKLEVSDGEEKYGMTFPIAANTPTVIYFECDDFIEDFRVDTLNVEAMSSGNCKLSSLRLTEPFVTEGTSLSFAKKSNCVWMSVLKGQATLTGDSVVLETANTECVLAVGTESYGVPDDEYSNTVRYVELAASEGHGAVNIEGANTSSAGGAFRNIDGEGKSVLARLTVPPHLGNVFEFKSSTAENITLSKICFVSTKEKPEGAYQPLTVLSVTDGILHGEGSLDSATVKEHRKKKLCVYMMPVIGGEPVMIGETGVATRFSFDISLENYPHAVSDSMFYVGITDSDGKVYKTGEAKFVSLPAVTWDDRSVYALSGVDPIAVYESGASTVMIDVDIAKLTSTGTTGSTTVTSGGYVYGFNNKYLSELDSSMDFYVTSDVSVYLRLICTEELRSRLDGTLLTYTLTGDEVILRSDTAEAVNMYSALTRFLCGRYQGISSIVLGNGVNSEKFTGIPTSDIYKYACDIAMAARVVGGNAAVTSGAFVTLPISTNGGESFSAEMMSSLVAERLSRIGPVPYALMYTSDKCEYPVAMSTVMNSIYLSGTAAVSLNVFCYEPCEPYDGLTDAYKELCDGAAQTNTVKVFLSQKRLAEKLSVDALNGLKKDMMTENSVQIDAEAIPLSSFNMNSVKGSAFMWDFTSAGSRLGWIPGYGISAMATVKETPLLDPSETRVLRCVTEDTENSVAGIMLCRYPMPINLGDAPYLEFVYKYTASHPVKTVFVFGNGENRAEFSVPAEIVPDKDGKYRVVCDLSEFSVRSDMSYAGIIIYSDEKVTFDLTSVRVMSKTLSNEEVKNLITKPSEEEKPPIPIVKITVITAVSAVLLIVAARVFVLLRRYDSKLVNVVKKRRKY